ncbi:phage holin family protein [Glaciihabitans sp. dw_435]|uniref:phage holin family protein n=1 Tax=Glaciihabitans sp. dw_435 TaxID=2720081 RepID=UPI001BD4D156|nr:phage holin family protein [Glaciihabitans sp. dw_435]
MAEIPREKKKSLFALLGDLPTLVRELVLGEIELLKAEVIRKLKAAGIGVGFILGAVVVLLFFIGVLLTAAILALSLVMPGWLAALIVAFVLLVVVAILALLGWRSLKKAIPPLPEKTISGVKLDINVIRGVGKRE